MNSITDLLDLEDSDINISDIIVEGQTKTLIIETPPVAHYCPTCGYRMHSRGVKKRTINHHSSGWLFLDFIPQATPLALFQSRLPV